MAPDYPRGSLNANWFSALNAVSFQIVLGAPMILYFKSLGATATVLGVAAAMTPLLNIAQIPAAHHLARTGYRRFILLGWGTRTIFVFAMALVPLLPFLGEMGQMSLLLLALFIFNLVRGAAAGAWLPWLTELIPEEIRGRFLSRDQVFLHAGSLLSLIFSSWMLQGGAERWQFSLLFFISALSATGSLIFLKRMPDVDASDVANGSNAPVPWLEIITYPPFLRNLIFTMIYVMAIGAAAVFGVSFMKTRLGFSESLVLMCGAGYFLGAILSLPFMGRLLDKTTSKRMLLCVLLVFVAIFAIWSLLAGGLLAGSLALVMALHVVSGAAGANFNLAHVRLIMGMMPPMGRSHFFAFFSVISSLGLALAPLLWGVVIDAIGAREASWGATIWNRYSVFYACSTLGMALSAAATFFLIEKKVHS